MKRSRAIDKLGARIYLELGPRIGDTIKANKLADLLLKDVEEFGMLPPLNLKRFKHSGGCHEWEPEDNEENK